MAKTDSFFIRASTDFNGNTFAQTSIDLGAYVDALGKSVLRVHNIAVAYGDAGEVPVMTPNEKSSASFQLTTQSQGALVNLTDKSIVASGRLIVSSGASSEIVSLTDRMDVAPQDFTKGYLIGVEQIYLGVNSSAAANMSLTSVQIVLECTVETLSQSAAMALALSQQ